jgi:hypothetical protein
MTKNTFVNNMGGELTRAPIVHNIPESILAVSENRLPVKDFFFTFVITELLKGRKPEDYESFIKFKIQRSNKIVEEMEMIKNFTDEELLDHKKLLDNSRLEQWEINDAEYRQKKKALQKVIDKIDKVKSPDKEFDAFFVHVKNKVKMSMLMIDEYIAANIKPDIEPDLEKWKKERIETLIKGKEENDRAASLEMENLSHIREWLSALEDALTEQLGPSLPVVSNESKG